MSGRTTTLVVGTAVLGLVAYAVYFDHKRRNDIDFRKKLRKDKKRVDKVVAQEKVKESESSTITKEDLKAALETIKREDVPPSVEASEQYFLEHVSIGENLSMRGPTFHLPAAMSFYRALRVYPQTVDLISIYQKTVPEPIFKLIIEMVDLNLKNTITGYYESFPPKSMNVAVHSIDLPDGSGATMRKKILIVTKDIKAGEVIYKEQPVVTVLDFDLQSKGSHCFYCLRAIQKNMAIRPADDRLNSVYCSKDCQVRSNIQHGNLLFTMEPAMPIASAQDMSREAKEDRDAAQKAFVEYVKKTAKAAPLLAARYLGRRVSVQTSKAIPTASSPMAMEFTGADNQDYTLADHFERLRYLELTPPDEEKKLIRGVLETAFPGLEQNASDETYPVVLGKVSYNAYGVCFGGGRDDKPPSAERPEDVERTRTPYGTSRQVGTGFYLVSSYIQHSCTPTARPSFSSGTAELHLIASRDLKKGEEVTVAYVDVTQHPDESPIESRRRRRQELARGWRFACTCARCISDGISSQEERAALPTEDGSRVEDSVSRLETGQATTA